MSLRNDSAKREVLLALAASPEPMTVPDLEKATGRRPSEVLEALTDLGREFIVLGPGTWQQYELTAILLRALRVLARGLHPLDRHITEAIAHRDGDSHQTSTDRETS